MQKARSVFPLNSLNGRFVSTNPELVVGETNQDRFDKFCFVCVVFECASTKG